MKNRSKTNWDKIDNMKDEDIDYSDSPEVTAEMFEKMELWHPEKRGIFIRLDSDIIEFFKKTSKHYQSTINSVLKAYKTVTEAKLTHK